jgi:hypothetical protein
MEFLSLDLYANDTSRFAKKILHGCRRLSKSGQSFLIFKIA